MRLTRMAAAEILASLGSDQDPIIHCGRETTPVDLAYANPDADAGAARFWYWGRRPGGKTMRVRGSYLGMIRDRRGRPDPAPFPRPASDGEKIVRALLHAGLQDSTWAQNHPDAMGELFRYEKDLAAHADRVLKRLRANRREEIR